MNKIKLRAVGGVREKKPFLVALKKSARVKGRSNEEVPTVSKGKR
jgi:hypothetical protein